MQSLLDHISAIIVACVVILVLAISNVRASHAGIEAVATHSVKAKTLVFGHWIERDILEIGRNMGRNRYRFEPPVLDAQGNTLEFRFYSDSTCIGACAFPDGVTGNAESVIRLHTRYVLDSTDAVTVRRGDSLLTRQLYILRREAAESNVIGGVAQPVPEARWRADRWTIGTISFFRVRMLLRDGTVTTDPTRGDYIRIQFGVVPEWILQPENFIRELYWATTLKVRPFWEPPEA